VMAGFAALVAGLGAQLALAGPAADDVSDDPEGREVREDCDEAWRALPARQRRQVRLVTLPLDDGARTLSWSTRSSAMSR